MAFAAALPLLALLDGGLVVPLVMPGTKFDRNSTASPRDKSKYRLEIAAVIREIAVIHM